MNKKTLFIIYGVVAVGIIAFATKKYWYKPKSSFYNMQDENEESEETQEIDIDEQNAKDTDEIAMSMSMGSSDDNDIDGDSMGELVNDMGNPASIMVKPMQQSILQAKAKNQSNINTPNFTPKMPNKNDVVRAKIKRGIRNIAIGVGGLGAIGLVSKLAKKKESDCRKKMATMRFRNKAGQQQFLKNCMAKKRKSGFSNFDY